MFLKCAHSSDLQAHLNTSVDVPCNFTLETYACAQVTFNVVFSTDWCQNQSLLTIQKPQVVWFSHRQKNFTAQQLASLLKCNLPGNSSHSRMIWKMLLTKSIMVLDPALDILANMVSLLSALWKGQMNPLHNDTSTWFHQQSMSIVVPSATEVLDVIREIRLNLLTEEQLRNQSVVTRWFSRRLSRLLPYASAQFLTCLNLRNLSCHSYQRMYVSRALLRLQIQSRVETGFVFSLLSECRCFPTTSTKWPRINRKL